MKDKNMEYLDNDYNFKRLVRTELVLMPLLIILPLIIGGFFIHEWFYRGNSIGVSDFDGQLIIGIIILVSNIMFDIPFIQDLMKFKRR